MTTIIHSNQVVITAAPETPSTSTGQLASTSPSPIIQSTEGIPPTPQLPPQSPNLPIDPYSPVAIILATGFLVGAIGKAINPGGSQGGDRGYAVLKRSKR